MHIIFYCWNFFICRKFCSFLKHFSCNVFICVLCLFVWYSYWMSRIFLDLVIARVSWRKEKEQCILQGFIGQRHLLLLQRDIFLKILCLSFRIKFSSGDCIQPIPHFLGSFTSCCPSSPPHGARPCFPKSLALFRRYFYWFTYLLTICFHNSSIRPTFVPHCVLSSPLPLSLLPFSSYKNSV